MVLPALTPCPMQQGRQVGIIIGTWRGGCWTGRGVPLDYIGRESGYSLYAAPDKTKQKAKSSDAENKFIT